jgi:hypothetical protein
LLVVIIKDSDNRKIMKNHPGRLLTLTFLIASTFLYGQVNRPIKLVADSIHPISGIQRKTEIIHIGQTNSTRLELVAARATDWTGILVYPTSPLGCSGASGNYISFQFKDGSSLTLDNDLGFYKCSGTEKKVSVYDVNNIRFNPVVKVRFKQSEGFIELDWVCEYSMQEIIDALK